MKCSTFQLRFLSCVALSLGVACGPEQGGRSSSGPGFLGGGKTGNNTDGGANGGASGGGGGIVFADKLNPGTGDGGPGSPEEPLGEGKCGQQKFDLQRVEPDVMLVLDRSGSMRRTAAGERGNGTNDKWTATASALSEVLNQTQANINWGMQIFPTCTATGTGYQCAPTPCTVAGGSQAPALNQAAALNTSIAAAAPILDTGATPTRAGIEAAVATLKKQNSGRKAFLLVATDGMPTCKASPASLTDGGEADPDGAVAAVAASVAAGIDVFVVGIATADTASSAQTLERMAEAGGRAQAGATKHYPVANRAELVAALSKITSQVRECTFELSTPPPSPTDVAVNIDGVRLMSGTDWDYGAGNMSVIVKGEWCTKLKSGAAKGADIIFGCPGVQIL